MYIYISSLWTSFPISSPQCIEFPVLYSRFSLVINFIQSINTVHMSNPISHSNEVSVHTGQNGHHQKLHKQ